MKDHVAAIESAITTLDNKAQQNISVSSIIVAIIGVLNIIPSNVDQRLHGRWDLHTVFIVAIFVVYGVIFVLSSLVIFLRNPATHPIKPTWDEAQVWLKLSLEDYYDKLLASYTDVIAINEQINRTKGNLVKWASILVVFDIILILFAIIMT